MRQVYLPARLIDSTLVITSFRVQTRGHTTSRVCMSARFSLSFSVRSVLIYKHSFISLTKKKNYFSPRPSVIK